MNEPQAQSVASDELFGMLFSMWMPIETAPKDGTGILGYQKIHGSELWVIGTMRYAETGWVFVEFHRGNTEYEMYPTHWMPLPGPPNTTGHAQARSAAEGL